MDNFTHWLTSWPISEQIKPKIHINEKSRQSKIGRRTQQIIYVHMGRLRRSLGSCCPSSTLFSSLLSYLISPLLFCPLFFPFIIFYLLFYFLLFYLLFSLRLLITFQVLFENEVNNILSFLLQCVVMKGTDGMTHLDPICHGWKLFAVLNRFPSTNDMIIL